MVKATCGLGLHAEFGFHFSEGEGGDAEDFLAGEITAEDGDGATRQAEFVGEKFAEYGGGAALGGRSVDLDLQGLTEPAAHHAARGLGTALIARVQEGRADAEGTECLTTDGHR